MPQKRLVAILSCVAAMSCEAAEPKGELQYPSPAAAEVAVKEMMGEDVAPLLEGLAVRLGTCIQTPAEVRQHSNSVSCAVAIVSAGGSFSSETQADFYQLDGRWRASPSSAQEWLPFPDPALR